MTRIAVIYYSALARIAGVIAAVRAEGVLTATPGASTSPSNGEE